MDLTPQDKLAASVFAAGIKRRHVRVRDIVMWADRRIEDMDVPPPWLIELSLSENKHLLDLIGELERLAADVDPASTCRAIYALLPDPGAMGFEQAEAFAAELYKITFECFDGDWNQELVSVTDALADNFEFMREGYLHWSQSRPIAALQQFVLSFRDESVIRLLEPIVWSMEAGPIRHPVRGASCSLCIALFAWIIQDGNYSDFYVGQQTDFALEFYPAKNFRRSQSRACRVEHLRSNRYEVTARVIFVSPEVWVIDAGVFMAFHEQAPPSDTVVGSVFEGELYLGIDPFFYFERLCKLERMPPLTYLWEIQEILRETTPWIEKTGADGRTFQVRDEQRESFVPTRETKAWRDEHGMAEYLLTCQRIAGPKNPAVSKK